MRPGSRRLPICFPLTSDYAYFAYNNTYQEPSVLMSTGGLRMWYYGQVGGVWGIYTASSNNGANWTVDRTPALMRGVNGSWDSGSVHGPSSVLYNGTGYTMYFTGNNNTSLQSLSIGVAFSADGVHWKEYSANPVLKPGPDPYDSTWIMNPSVVLRNGTYYMWYTGRSSPDFRTPGGIYPFYAINLATSHDGIHWTKYTGNPVFLGAPDQILLGKSVVGHPDVLDVNGTLIMLYGDGDSIRYATSYDGIRWTPTHYDLVNSEQAYWKSGYTSEPSALLNGTRLTLWYYGQSPLKYSSPYIAGIGLAYCGLVIVPVKATTTVVSTSTTTVTFPNVTVTQTEAASKELGYYQALSVGLAVAAVVMAALVVLVRRLGRRPWSHTPTRQLTMPNEIGARQMEGLRSF